MPYDLSQLPRVLQQIRDLETRAIAAGRRREYVAALQWVIERLQNDPLEWGYPEYHPKKTGSCVCHGIHDGLFVQYVVYENEKSVLILTIKAMPSSSMV